jgi:hypothetical protein
MTKITVSVCLYQPLRTRNQGTTLTRLITLYFHLFCLIDHGQVKHDPSHRHPPSLSLRLTCVLFVSGAADL